MTSRAILTARNERIFRRNRVARSTIPETFQEICWERFADETEVNDSILCVEALSSIASIASFVLHLRFHKEKCVSVLFRTVN